MCCCSWIIARSRMDKPNPCARIGVTCAADRCLFPLVWGFFCLSRFFFVAKNKWGENKVHLGRSCSLRFLVIGRWWQELSLFL